MNDIDCTLTDFALALLCLWAIVKLLKTRHLGVLSGWFAVFFAGLGGSALIGGIYHGFLRPGTAAANHTEILLMVLAGVPPMAAWSFGAYLQFRPQLARWLVSAAVLNFILYALIVIFVSQSFLISTLNYIPAAIFLAFVFGRIWRQHPGRGAGWCLAGDLLIFAAGIQQASGLGIHPDYFDHNSIYHLLLGIAVGMVVTGAIALLEPEAPSTRKS